LILLRLKNIFPGKAPSQELARFLLYSIFEKYRA